MKKLILPFLFVFAMLFSAIAVQAQSLLLYKDTNEKYGYKDDKDNIVIEPKYDALYLFSEGLVLAKQNGKYGYLDNAGKVFIDFKYEDAGFFSEGLASVQINGKWGYMDKTEKVIIKPQYDVAYSFKNGVARVQLNYVWSNIDKTGKTLSSEKQLTLDATSYNKEETTTSYSQSKPQVQQQDYKALLATLLKSSENDFANITGNKLKEENGIIYNATKSGFGTGDEYITRHNSTTLVYSLDVAHAVAIEKKIPVTVEEFIKSNFPATEYEYRQYKDENPTSKGIAITAKDATGETMIVRTYSEDNKQYYSLIIFGKTFRYATQQEFKTKLAALVKSAEKDFADIIGNKYENNDYDSKIKMGIGYDAIEKQENPKSIFYFLNSELAKAENKKLIPAVDAFLAANFPKSQYDYEDYQEGSATGTMIQIKNTSTPLIQITKDVTTDGKKFYQLYIMGNAAIAQNSKNFAKQFEAIAKASLSDVKGDKKDPDFNDIPFNYPELYKSTLPLNEFRVVVGESNLVASIIALYEGKTSDEVFDKILTKLKTLPYDFETKTGNKSYRREIAIKSKDKGETVATLIYENSGFIKIDFGYIWTQTTK